MPTTPERVHVAPFDTIDPARLRAGTGIKWGVADEDVIPSWVADMDFGIPPAVQRAMRDVVDRQDFGYPHWPDGDPVVAAFERRMADRFGWAPRPGRTRSCRSRSSTRRGPVTGSRSMCRRTRRSWPASSAPVAGSCPSR
jgi:hypothetical protein